MNIICGPHGKQVPETLTESAGTIAELQDVLWKVSPSFCLLLCACLQLSQIELSSKIIVIATLVWPMSGLLSQQYMYISATSVVLLDTGTLAGEG